MYVYRGMYVCVCVCDEFGRMHIYVLHIIITFKRKRANAGPRHNTT